MLTNFRFIFLAFFIFASRVQAVGVNWGTSASHPLPPLKVVRLLKSNNINKVKLFDADSDVLQALSGSNIGVTVGIPNTMLRSFNASKKASDSWVHDNVTRYFSNGGTGVRIEYVLFIPLWFDIGFGFTFAFPFLALLLSTVSALKKCGSNTEEFRAEIGFWIRDGEKPCLVFIFLVGLMNQLTGIGTGYVAVGDEPFLQSYGEQFHPFVIGAVTNIQAALMKAKLDSKVKVVVPCSFDSFQSDSNLPSKAHFRPDVNKTMIELLTFLDKHGSPFFVSISPFLTLLQNRNTSLDFTLFKETAHIRNDSHKAYKNSFDLSYDTVVTALSTAGFPNMNIVVSKIGWPTDGAINATTYLAETFMKGLMNHLHGNLAAPLKLRHPPSETYLFSLLDEDQRSTASGNFERHWGMFTFDGQAKYHVDLGQGSSKSLVNAQDVEYLSPKWCVVNNNKDLSNATASALDACSNADCTALSSGGSCFNISWPSNISYAFNSYYQQHDQKAESCDFGGLGLITTVDPSMDHCRFSIEIRTSHSERLRVYYHQWIMALLIATLLAGFCRLT
ncbi:Glucan endo-1,3-beta-glucosidase 9 [Senna tora]|uniref:glucan endo-1,3-beta-D-glucosidase n=1 Tax=Senna tora TaxID=362788 RepID=A0A834WWT0_9FABA|nr:Glucan endo-1,3-beta-glucosidase 9 [Senna tora]